MRRLPPPSLLPFLFAGCALEPSPPEALPDTGNPALHAIHDARLRHSMDEMNNLMFERMRTELELDRDRRKQAARIAETATAMRQAVGGIIGALPRLDLRANERIVFLTLAETLRGQVEALEDQARENAIDPLPHTFDLIRATCTECHQLFRKLDQPPKGDL